MHCCQFASVDEGKHRQVEHGCDDVLMYDDCYRLVAQQTEEHQVVAHRRHDGKQQQQHTLYAKRTAGAIAERQYRYAHYRDSYAEQYRPAYFLFVKDVETKWHYDGYYGYEYRRIAGVDEHQTVVFADEIEKRLEEGEQEKTPVVFSGDAFDLPRKARDTPQQGERDKQPYDNDEYHVEVMVEQLFRPHEADTPKDLSQY